MLSIELIEFQHKELEQLRPLLGQAEVTIQKLIGIYGDIDKVRVAFEEVFDKEYALSPVYNVREGIIEVIKLLTDDILYSADVLKLPEGAWNELEEVFNYILRQYVRM